MWKWLNFKECDKTNIIFNKKKIEDILQYNLVYYILLLYMKFLIEINYFVICNYLKKNVLTINLIWLLLLSFKISNI